MQDPHCSQLGHITGSLRPECNPYEHVDKKVVILTVMKMRWDQMSHLCNSPVHSARLKSIKEISRSLNHLQSNATLEDDDEIVAKLTRWKFKNMLLTKTTERWRRKSSTFGKSGQWATVSTQRGETCHHNYFNSGGLIIFTLFVKIVWVSYHFSCQGVCCDRNDYSRHDEEVNHQTSTAEMFPLILEGSHPEMTSVVKRAKGSEISVTETIR